MNEEEKERLRSLNGVEWQQEVGKIWDETRSRFATSWDDMPHHDRVSVFRLLIR